MVSKIPHTDAGPGVPFRRLDTEPIQLGRDLLVRHPSRELPDQIRGLDRRRPAVLARTSLAERKLRVLTTLPMDQYP